MGHQRVEGREPKAEERPPRGCRASGSRARGNQGEEGAGESRSSVGRVPGSIVDELERDKQSLEAVATELRQQNATVSAELTRSEAMREDNLAPK